MRIIVTGGSGFIGSRLVSALSGGGHHVRVIDTLPCAVLGVKTDTQSVLDGLAMREAIQDAEAVVHLAGPVRDAMRHDPYSASSLQLQGTLNVLEACRLNGIPHFILASSFYVYHGLPETSTVDETTALAWLRMEPFGAAKVMSEVLCHEYTRKYGLNHTILRLGSAYGPGGSNVIRTFLESGIQDKTLEVWGQGKRRNQYTFVGDLVNGIVASLDTRNETFNLCSPQPVTTASLADMLTCEFDFTVNFNRTRPEEASFPLIYSHKAIARLNWNPIDLQQGLHMTFQELRSGLT